MTTHPTRGNPGSWSKQPRRAVGRAHWRTGPSDLDLTVGPVGGPCVRPHPRPLPATALPPLTPPLDSAAAIPRDRVDASRRANHMQEQAGGEGPALGPPQPLPSPPLATNAAAPRNWLAAGPPTCEWSDCPSHYGDGLHLWHEGGRVPTGGCSHGLPPVQMRGQQNIAI